MRCPTSAGEGASIHHGNIMIGCCKCAADAQRGSKGTFPEMLQSEVVHTTVCAPEGVHSFDAAVVLR